MLRNLRMLLSSVIFVGLLVSCASLSGQKEEIAPVIGPQMSLEQAFDAATRFGGETLEQVKKLVSTREQWPVLEQMSKNYLLSENPTDKKEFLNAIHLYRVSAARLDPKLLKSLFSRDEVFYQKVAWQLAALKPDTQLIALLEEQLSLRVSQNQFDLIMLPEMARAVKAHQMRGVYTLLREGLMRTGADDFAISMLSLNPELAASDFISYLAKTDLEDLRQINQKNINIYSCLVILRFFNSYPLPVEHPQLGVIFQYAVSRNAGLNEMARSVLDRQIPRFKDELAFSLARESSSVQLAFVEGSRQQASSNIRVLLDNLVEITAYKEVAEEIAALTR